MQTSVAMARMAYEHGTRVIACTPHRLPGRYDTTPEQIDTLTQSLREAVQADDNPIVLVSGSDVHIAPDLDRILEQAPAYRLRGTRYFLYEPPHQFAPPNMLGVTQRILKAGFVPIITHPERLLWVHRNYDLATALNDLGCLVQVTANALTGGFGSNVRKLAIRFVEDGRVDIIASDAHNLTSRPPVMDAARAVLVDMVGEDEADAMTLQRPAAILRDEVIVPVAVGMNARVTGTSDKSTNVPAKGRRESATGGVERLRFWKRLFK